MIRRERERERGRMKVTVLFLSISLLVALCPATPLTEKLDKMSVLEQQSVTLTDRAKYEEELLRKLNSKCSQNDMSSCVMLKLVTYMNKLLKKASIKLTDDIEIRKTSQASEEVITFEAGRSKDDESEVLDLVANKVYAFVKSRSIKWRILPEDDVVVSASEDENGSLNLGLSIERADNVPVQDGKHILLFQLINFHLLMRDIFTFISILYYKNPDLEESILQ